jgi:hypothetical protein
LIKAVFCFDPDESKVEGTLFSLSPEGFSLEVATAKGGGVRSRDQPSWEMRA